MFFQAFDFSVQCQEQDERKMNFPVKALNNHRSSHRRCSVRKVVLRNFAKFTGKHLCQSEFCEISKKTFTEHLWAAASETKCSSSTLDSLFRIFFINSLFHLCWRFPSVTIIKSLVVVIPCLYLKTQDFYRVPHCLLTTAVVSFFYYLTLEVKVTYPSESLHFDIFN